VYTFGLLMATTRNKPFKSPAPRLPQEGSPQFLHKLDPWFVDLARVFKETVPPVGGAKRTDRASRDSEGRGRQPAKSVPAPLLPGWPRTLGEMLSLAARIEDPRIAGVFRALEQEFPKEALAMDLNPVLENGISLLKYQETVPELRWRELQGDRNAGRKVVETADLYNRWMHGQLPHGGVRVKTNVHHNLLMLFGLPAGLEKLTSKELADFFDQFCPCGETHTLEVLRRLRQKLLIAADRGAKSTSLLDQCYSHDTAEH
jgi:hypothetical protein